MFRTVEHLVDDIWEEILDLHCPDGGYVAVLRAYVDAGTHPDTGLLTVGAYLMESGRARRFRQQWRDTFGDAKFSWADLIARGKPFRHLRDDRAEHDRLVAAGVSIVRDYALAGSVVSCWKQDIERFSPTFVKGFGHAYSIAGHMAAVGMARAAKRNGHIGPIAYVIEAGDEGYDQLDHLLSYASKVPSIAEFYQWGGHSTTPKTVASPFHAPDLLAWEWAKYWDDTVVQKKRRIRLSLVHLLKERLDSYTFQHLGGESLLKFLNSIRDLGVEQMQADRDALASAPAAADLSELLASEQTEHVEDHE